MQVLDKEKNVIPGLYAIGNVSGSFFANNYPELFPGLDVYKRQQLNSGSPIEKFDPGLM